jgi:putative chitinase
MEAKGPTSPMQRKGEISGAVKKTEKLLKKLGFNPGNVDGHYTSATQKAVNQFRRQEGLGGIGQGVGANALKKLKRAASRNTVSAGELVRIMPGLSMSRARELEPHLNKAMREFGINTKKRQAAFLAQVGHESVSLRYFEEIASGAAYEGRSDLGNIYPGDGVRYKGRGPIQLTGRANYRRAGNALGLNLEGNPKMAARKSVGFRTAGWFWKTHGLNELADRGDFDTISRRINGGDNGLYDRRAYWARAKAVLA